ncbi:12232_t:CDS:1, partial [Acaulospora colombiana]
MSIQKSVSDLVPTIEKLEAEYPNTYLEKWFKIIQGNIKTHKTVAKAISHRRQPIAIRKRIQIRQEQYNNN